VQLAVLLSLVSAPRLLGPDLPLGLQAGGDDRVRLPGAARSPPQPGGDDRLHHQQPRISRLAGAEP